MTAPVREDAKADGAKPDDAKSATTMDLEQEVRLAVVLYGGVSLAIYINGVAQELLRLVRATAPSAPGSSEPLIKDDDLDPVEKIYRELGMLLRPTRATAADPPRVIRTRFVVDVISGTSAGGINGIFLACSLARHQFMRELKDLWVSEGDLAKLLNDAASVGDLDGRLRVPNPPKSLLNSRRMFIKLFEALQGMEPFEGENAGLREGEQSALVDELDLFVTATDLKGLVVKLGLADQIVYERRYRNVFHFVHSTLHGAGGDQPRNDLKWPNNGFLAFAARCTSSFPAAFEPMTLQQAIDDLGADGNNPDVRRAIEGEWPRFYRDYRDPAEVPGRELNPWRGKFEERPFGDGGYLDNKPFGHAISALRNRRADLPVRRVMVYVEPSPQHPELDHDVFDSPDALENLQLAASTLPRQETIREDLERVLERNRQIEYVRRATAYIGRDFKLSRFDPGLEGPKGQWQSRWLEDVVTKGPTPDLPLERRLPLYGGGYGAYHRLKVSEVTSEMAELIARVVGLDPDSDEVTAVRYLVSAWRLSVYRSDPDPELPEAVSENEFLTEFDLSYRLRRLQFVQDRMQYFILDDVRHADDILRITEGDEDGRPPGERLKRWKDYTPEDRVPIRRELRRLRGLLAQVQTDLRAAGRRLRQPTEENPLLSVIAGLGIGWEDLKAILRAPNPVARTAKAREILGIRPSGKPPETRPSRLARVHAVTDQLAERLHEAFSAATQRVLGILHPVEGDLESGDLFRRVRHCLWHQYRRYDYFDMMLFPMLAGTTLGELQPMTVLRVSPEDAPRLVEERDAGTHQHKRSKLAGTRLGNFGAFLDPVWRRSDILWGRLDAAERIVRGVAPQAGPLDADDDLRPARESLLARLQTAIVRQELLPLGLELGRQVFVEALLHTRSRTADYEALTRFAGQILAENTDPDLAILLESSALRDVYTRRFRENLSLDRETELRLIARGSQVLGNLLDGLSMRKAALKQQLAWWLVTLGRILFGVVEIAVPRSIWELFGIYWINLLYALEIVMIVAGQFITRMQPARDLGLLLLAATIAVDFARRLVAASIQRKVAWTVWWVIGALGAGVLWLGVLRVRELVNQAAGWLNTAKFAWAYLLGGLVVVVGVIQISRWLDRWLDGLDANRRAKLEAKAEAERERNAAREFAAARAAREARRRQG